MANERLQITPTPFESATRTRRISYAQIGGVHRRHELVAQDIKRRWIQPGNDPGGRRGISRV